MGVTKDLDDAVRRVLAKAAPQHDPDLFRNWLAFFLISAFVAQLPLLMWVAIPASNKEIIVYIIGQLSGMATTALAFYFTQKAGQDKLDAARATTTAKMADAITATANAGTPEPAKTAADTVANAANAAAAEIKGDANDTDLPGHEAGREGG